MRVDKEYSASKFHSLTHELKTECDVESTPNMLKP